MTSLKFWQFDIKAFFRAPQWEVAIVAKIFMAIFAPDERLPCSATLHGPIPLHSNLSQTIYIGIYTTY